MSDTRILEKVPGSVFRYRFGAFQFSATCDEHAHRMRDAYLAKEAKKSQPWQDDPLTPRQRLRFETDPNTDPDVEAKAVLAGFAKRSGEAIVAAPTKKKATKKKATKKKEKSK